MSNRFPFTKLAHSPVKPELVLTNGEDYLVLNTSNGEIIKSLSTDKLEKDTVHDDFRSMNFNEDGSLFAASGENKKICVWDTKDWSLKLSRSAHKRVNALQFDSKATTVVVADKFGDVYCHPMKEEDSEKLNPIVGHVSMVTDMALTPDDKYVITSDRDEHIRVSRYPNGYNIEAFCLGHTDVVTCVDILPWNENLLVSAGGDGTIRVWEYVSGKQIQCLDLREQIEPYKPVAADANSEDAIVNRLTFDSKDKLVVVGFAKANACIALEWKEDAFSYKDTLVTRLPILDIAFDLEQKLWVSLDPKNNDDNDLISVFRLKDSKFEAVESNDGLVKQVNVTPVTRVKVMPDLYTIFGLRKFLDLPENMDGEEGKGSKKRKTE
ncbi:hypothetical protein RMCBS344292_11896 [Rhizopus microsporus]|nr:hypothetical protein RMCBS344292_11896 [Rhizopus microsporus]